MAIFSSYQPSINAVTAAVNAGPPPAAGAISVEAGVKAYLQHANNLHTRVTRLEQESKKSPGDRLIRDLAASARILVQDYDALRTAPGGAATLNAAINVQGPGGVALRRQQVANRIYDDLGRRIDILRYKHAPGWLEWLGLRSSPDAVSHVPGKMAFAGAGMLTCPLWVDSVPEIPGFGPNTSEPVLPEETPAGTFAPLWSALDRAGTALGEFGTIVRDNKTNISYGAAAVGGMIMASKLGNWVWHKIAYGKPTLDTSHELRIKFIDVMPDQHEDDKHVKASVTKLEEGFKSVHERYLRLRDRVEESKKNPSWLYPTLYADWEVVTNEARTLQESVDDLQETTMGHTTFSANLAELDTQVKAMRNNLTRMCEDISWSAYNRSLPRRFKDSITKTQILGLCMLPIIVEAEVVGAVSDDPMVSYAAHGVAAFNTALLLGQPVAGWFRTNPIKAHLRQVEEHGTIEPHFPRIGRIPADYLSRKNRKGAIDAFDKEVNRLEEQVKEMTRKVKGGVVQDDTIEVDVKTLELDWNALKDVYLDVDREMQISGEISAKLDEANDKRCDVGTSIIELRKLAAGKPNKIFTVARASAAFKRPLPMKAKATISSQRTAIRAAEESLKSGKMREAIDGFKTFVTKFKHDCEDLREHQEAGKLKGKVLKANLNILMDDYRELTRLANLIQEKQTDAKQNDEPFCQSKRTLSALENTLRTLRTTIHALKDDEVPTPSTAWFSKTTKVAVPYIALAGASYWQNDMVEQWAGAEAAQYAPLALGAIAATAVACKAIGWLWGLRSSSSATVGKPTPTVAEPKPKSPLLTVAVAEAQRRKTKELTTATVFPMAQTAPVRSEDIAALSSGFKATKVHLIGLIHDRKFTEARRVITQALEEVQTLMTPAISSSDRGSLQEVVQYLEELQGQLPSDRRVQHALFTSAPSTVPTVEVVPTTERVEERVTVSPHARKKFTSGVERGTYSSGQEVHLQKKTFSADEAQLAIALLSVIAALKGSTGTLGAAAQFGVYKHAQFIEKNPGNLSDTALYLNLLSQEKKVAPFHIEREQICSGSSSSVDFERTLAQMDELRHSGGHKQILVPIVMQGVSYALAIEGKGPREREVVLSGVHPHPHVLGTVGHFRKTFSSVEEAGQCLAAMNEELARFVPEEAPKDVVFYPCIPTAPIERANVNAAASAA